MPLKALSNFLRTLDMQSINCEVNLIITWSKKCLLTSKATRDIVSAQGGNPAVAAVENTTSGTFKTTGTKLYVSVVTFSTEDDNNFFRTIKIRI